MATLSLSPLCVSTELLFLFRGREIKNIFNVCSEGGSANTTRGNNNDARAIVQAPAPWKKESAHKQMELSFCFSVRYANNGSRSERTKKNLSSEINAFELCCTQDFISPLSTCLPEHINEIKLGIF